MKTIFKVGMEVYDSVNYPNEKGEVIEVESKIPYTPRPIQVKFQSNIEEYTLDGRIGTIVHPDRQALTSSRERGIKNK